jgi:hypothetical protein
VLTRLRVDFPLMVRVLLEYNQRLILSTNVGNARKTGGEAACVQYVVDSSKSKQRSSVCSIYPVAVSWFQQERRSQCGRVC